MDENLWDYLMSLYKSQSSKSQLRAMDQFTTGGRYTI